MDNLDRMTRAELIEALTAERKGPVATARALMEAKTAGERAEARAKVESDKAARIKIDNEIRAAAQAAGAGSPDTIAPFVGPCEVIGDKVYAKVGEEQVPLARHMATVKAANPNLFTDSLAGLRHQAAGGVLPVNEYMRQREVDRTKLGLRPPYQRPAAVSALLQQPEEPGPEEEGGAPVLA